MLTELTRKRKKISKLTCQLLRASPTRWFFLRNIVLRQEPRLPRSINQKRQLQCPAPERRSRRNLKPGLVAHRLATGSMLGPPLDDVSFFFLLVALCFFQLELFCTCNLCFFLLAFTQPLMKRLIDIGSHFIGFRDDAVTLKGKILTQFFSYMLSWFLYLHLLFSFCCRSVASRRRTR
jgi:hypothetical protein